MLEIPGWLANRLIKKDDNEYLKLIKNIKEINYFGEISNDLMKQVYLEFDRKEFFRLIRIFGFYGVQFTGKLSAYSFVFEEKSQIISIDENFWEETIGNINQEYSSVLISLGINKLKYLHGVPFSNLKSVIEKNCETYKTLDKFKANAIPVSNFSFSSFNKYCHSIDSKVAEDKSETNETDAMELPVSILNLSVRARNGLDFANILTIGQLIQKTEGDLMQLRNFGRKTVKEINESLKSIGMSLGLNVAKIGTTGSVKKIDLLDQPIEYLSFSVRTTNCLKNININTIKDLVLSKESNLTGNQGFGRSSLTETKRKLSEFRLNLGFKQSDIENWYLEEKSKDYGSIEITLQQPEIRFENLVQLVEDLDIPIRLRNALAKLKIKYLWELVQYTEADLLKIGNLGRTTINRLRQILNDLGISLGMSFTQEQKTKIAEFQNRNIQKYSAVDLIKLAECLENDPLNYLNDIQKVVVNKRLWAVSKKLTLEEIAKEFGVTRERIRQIEKKTIDTIAVKFLRKLRESVGDLVRRVDDNNGLMVLEDIGIGIETLPAKAKAIIENLIKTQKERCYIDWENGLICTLGLSWYENVCDSIQTELAGKFKKNQLFKIRDLVKAVKLFSSEQQFASRKVRKKLVKKFIKERVVASIDGMFSLSRISKQDIAALAFKKQFPKGLHVYKEKDLLKRKLNEYDQNTFKNLSTRAVVALVTNSFPKVLLWGVGFVIHKDGTNFNEYIVKKVRDWIIERFDEGKSRFTVWLPFNRFEKEIISSGIPNAYALYSTLRLLNDARMGLKKFPNISDINKVSDLTIGVLIELESFFFQRDEAVSIEDLKKEFVVDRGWKEYRLQQTLSSAEFVFPWMNSTYIHREKLNINESKLDELTSKIVAKLNTINGTISLKGVKNEFGILWEQVCPSATTRTMAKLIRSIEHEDLFIQGDFVGLLTGSKDFSSTSAEVEMYVIEKGLETTTYELNEEFLGLRGWSRHQFYNALNKAYIFKSSNNTYIHPSIIEWDDELASKISETLQKYLSKRLKLGQPHALLEEIIDDYVLPELPNDVQWTAQLIKSVGEEIEEFIFFDESYIATDNSFGIEDLDDLIGYLITKHFDINLAKKDEITKLLWREGILESGSNIPSKVFYDGSSIEYIESSEEIRLSHQGKLKYARKQQQL